MVIMAGVLSCGGGSESVRCVVVMWMAWSSSSEYVVMRQYVMKQVCGSEPKVLSSLQVCDAELGCGGFCSRFVVVKWGVVVLATDVWWCDGD